MFHLFPRTLTPQRLAWGGTAAPPGMVTSPDGNPYGTPKFVAPAPGQASTPVVNGGDGSAQTNIGQAQTFSSPDGFLPQSNINFGGGQYAPLANTSAGNVSALQNMLMAQARGAGPNLGQMQLQSATDQNIKNAMALGQSMPGQSNMAAQRNILENQAGAQQQEAGQSAQLRAQQQLAAEQQLGQLGLGGLGTAGGLMTDAQKMALQESQGNQAVAMQGVGMGAKLAGNLISAAGAAGAQAINSGNSGGGGATPATTNPDGTYTGTTGDGTTVTVGDPASLGGGYARGGMILGRMLAHRYATGGEVDPNQVGSLAAYDYVPPSQVGGGASPLGLTGLGMGASGGSGDTTAQDLETYGKSGLSLIPFGAAAVGVHDALNKPMVDAGFGMKAPTQQQIADNGSAAFTPGNGGFNLFNINSWFKAGGEVPGQARTAGDSEKNDTVPAMLSPGEGVVPRSAMGDEDKASAFIRMVVRQHKKK